MTQRLFCVVFLILWANISVAATEVFESGSVPAFSFFQNNSGTEGSTLLVIGGIQGDEPGGFHAASLLASRYRIQKGNVWVVPNLNFLSIIKRSRGIHGDLNRKFAELSPKDPDSSLVSQVKLIIEAQEVDVVMNLHDGSGFYRPTYIDRDHNPQRWGQSIIVDQEVVGDGKYSRIGDMARGVAEDVNVKLTDAQKHYGVKNTETAKGDMEMAKSLTYFAIKAGKPAFGVEASKAFNKAERVYCHLQVLESFMKKMGIQFERDFDLDVLAVAHTIEENRRISFYDRRIDLDLSGARNQLRFFPLATDRDIEFSTYDPLLTLIPSEDTGNYFVYHGNERLTRLEPQFFRFDTETPSLHINADGQEREVAIGDTISVGRSFTVKPIPGYRINIIGYSSSDADEAGKLVSHSHCAKQFSIDKKGRLYRVELYRLAKKEEGESQDLFAGMVLVRFGVERDA